jgi:endonuclease YncB( thermonuclease family)
MVAGFSALLLEVDNDYMFHFSYHDTAFYCRPAAIDTIDQLSLYPDKSKVCLEQAQSFIKKHPYANKQYAYKLHEEQKYEVVGLKDECFVMLNAGVSFSEHLLEQGFAKLRTNLSSEFLQTTEYKNLLRSQQRAEYHRRGIWSDDILPKCF